MSNPNKYQAFGFFLLGKLILPQCLLMDREYGGGEAAGSIKNMYMEL